jgi:hypothetical protein
MNVLGATFLTFGLVCQRSAHDAAALGHGTSKQVAVFWFHRHEKQGLLSWRLQLGRRSADHMSGQCSRLAGCKYSSYLRGLVGLLLACNLGGQFAWHVVVTLCCSLAQPCHGL